MKDAVKKAIEDMTYRTKKFPEEPFRIISENKELALPALCSAVEKAISEADDLEEDYQLHFYALHLLAQFQEKSAFPKIMELAALPSEVLENLIGDTITISLSDILYNTYDGDLELLEMSIKDPCIDEFARSAMLKVMGQLYLDGSLEKGRFQDFIRQVMHGDEEAGGYIYTELVHIMCECNFVEMLPEIRQLFQDGLVDGQNIGGYEECVDMMFEYKEKFCEAPVNAADMLRGWYMFEQPEKENPFGTKEMEKFFRMAEAEYNKPEKKIKIGRNDPCPCGSGKKYKKCCLNKPKTPVELVESPEEKKKWLKHYPISAEERQEGRIYLEDYFDRESIEIDKLLYLALAHRAIPIWRREEESVVENRKRVYLSEAFSKFAEKMEKEQIKTFQEYDEKYSIHYQCGEWIPVLRELLEEDGDEELYRSVSACWEREAL